MIIGLDLDNTIINYDLAFYKSAIKEKFLDKKYKQKKKEKIKDIVTSFSEDDWTELQGIVYGDNINYAKINTGFKNFLRFCIKNNYKVIIISHKTKYPIIGKKTNLHNIALKFLKTKINEKIILNKNIFFEKTIEKKLERINKCNCDYFIDDLSKILKNKNFPKETKRILYGSKDKKLDYFLNWRQIEKFFKSLNRNFKNNKGTNNEIIISTDRKLVKKKYKDFKTKKDRFTREVRFLEYLKKNKVFNVPQIVRKNVKEYEIIYKYIKGKNFNKKTLDKNDLSKLIEFIKKINKPNKKNNFRYAKEFKKKSINYLSEISHKLRILSHSKEERLINNLNKKVFLLKKNNYFKNKYLFKEKFKILSPCDFNVNNILIHKNKFYYTDFEYSGYDDFAKLFAVFFTQPDLNVNYFVIKKKFQDLIFFKDKNEIIKNLEYLMPICYIRWAIIILNQIIKNKDSNKKNFYRKKYDLYLKNNIKKFNLYRKFIY